MQIFNLTKLNSSQEVPRVLYKPINITAENIYFEKIVIALDDTWSEGIWEYNIYDHNMFRLDQGQHAEHTQLYDFDTPVNTWNGKTEIENTKMYFATITEIDDDDFIEFYEINLESRVQRSILGFKFDKNAFMYKNMEIIAPGYILFRLSYDLDLADSDFFDNVYLLDVENKKYYEIKDEAFKINFGRRIIIGDNPENQYIVLEEFYLSEEEQYEVLTSEETELAFDLPGDLDPDHIHKNSVKIIKLEDFIEQVIEGKTEIGFEIIDEVNQDGVIRIIGETDTKIYYKKEYYDFVLKDKGDFVSLRKIGRYEVYSIDKETLGVSYVWDIEKNIEIKTNNNHIYEIRENSKDTVMIDLETNKEFYIYEKKHANKLKEEILEFLNNEYLVVKVRRYDEKSSEIYKIVDAYTKETLIIGNDVLVLDEYIFVI